MDDEVLSTHKDNDRADHSDSTDRESEIISNPIPHEPPIHPKTKRRIFAFASLCLISAIIGGLTTVAAIPYIYPAKTSPLQTQTTSSIAPVSYTDNQPNFPVSEISKKVGPAVVGVSNFQSNRSTTLQVAGSGSGFIIDAENGYITTNYHVIEGAKKITVSLSDGRNLEAKVIGSDARTDLAVLQISDVSNLTAVNLGDSSKVEVGEPVVAIGNPGGNDFARSVTTGVISATDRALDLQGESSFGLFQTDAAINPGNSGGPLVNYKGQVIGINSAKYAQTGFEGMGFSIPITDAMPTLEQLIKSGVAKHPALLVSTDDQYNIYAKSNNEPLGVYLAAVTANGPAAKAGLVKGDVLTKINDAQVQNTSDLIRELYKNKVGDNVAITYLRDGVSKQVQATLGEISSTQ
ncbi:MAG TPA: trypsin-like peptidase domain-containing protein [Desulfosporosinus sp.]|nr:trypsin-like peptidase domain-containing protein [Desulfosporosinus sp.]